MGAREACLLLFKMVIAVHWPMSRVFHMCSLWQCMCRFSVLNLSMVSPFFIWLRMGGGESPYWEDSLSPVHSQVSECSSVGFNRRLTYATAREGADLLVSWRCVLPHQEHLQISPRAASCPSQLASFVAVLQGSCLTLYAVLRLNEAVAITSCAKWGFLDIGKMEASMMLHFKYNTTGQYLWAFLLCDSWMVTFISNVVVIAFMF